MSAQIAPYRVTAEDLPDLKNQVVEALQPLLDSLNVTLGDVVTALNGASSEEVRTLTLVTGSVVADSFPFIFTTSVPQPRVVLLGNIIPKDPDHDLSTPFTIQGFGLTDQGLVSIQSITGLEPLNTYTLVLWIRS